MIDSAQPAIAIASIMIDLLLEFDGLRLFDRHDIDATQVVTVIVPVSAEIYYVAASDQFATGCVSGCYGLAQFVRQGFI